MGIKRIFLAKDLNKPRFYYLLIGDKKFELTTEQTLSIFDTVNHAEPLVKSEFDKFELGWSDPNAKVYSVKECAVVFGDVVVSIDHFFWSLSRLSKTKALDDLKPEHQNIPLVHPTEWGSRIERAKGYKGESYQNLGDW